MVDGNEVDIIVHIFIGQLKPIFNQVGENSVLIMF